MVITQANLKSGFIGEVLYYIEKKLPGPTQEEKENLRDSYVRSKINALMNQSVMNNDDSFDPVAEFQRSWKEGSNQNTNQSILVPKGIYHQVGQKESIQELIKIENLPGFKGWQDPYIIDQLLTWPENY